MVNTWNQCQVMATFNLSRSTSGYETGIGRGMGFRDSNQDVLGFVHLLPDRARQRLLDIAATQLSDGTCYHQYQPLTKKGNADAGSGFNDDPLWLVLSTCAYLRETGDATILGERIGFADQPGSQTPCSSISRSRSPTRAQPRPARPAADRPRRLERLPQPQLFFLAAQRVVPDHGQRGPGRCRRVRHDRRPVPLRRARPRRAYRWLKRDADAARLDGYRAEMLEVIETQAWDGGWYTRAFDAEAGRWVRRLPRGKIYIESQAWCVLGGAGPEQRPRPQGARRRRPPPLPPRPRLRPAVAGLLHLPSRTRRGLQLSAGLQGERRGVFPQQHLDSHRLDALRRGRESARVLPDICPAAKADHDVYRSEPYVYAQMTASHLSPTPGEAKNSWLTGTAAWSFVVASQYILGIQPDYDGLRSIRACRRNGRASRCGASSAGWSTPSR